MKLSAAYVCNRHRRLQEREHIAGRKQVTTCLRPDRVWPHRGILSYSTHQRYNSSSCLSWHALGMQRHQTASKVRSLHEVRQRPTRLPAKLGVGSTRYCVYGVRHWLSEALQQLLSILTSQQRVGHLLMQQCNVNAMATQGKAVATQWSRSGNAVAAQSSLNGHAIATQWQRKWQRTGNAMAMRLHSCTSACSCVLRSSCSVGLQAILDDPEHPVLNATEWYTGAHYFSMQSGRGLENFPVTRRTSQFQRSFRYTSKAITI